jgi:phosphatidylserine decarboxylase
LGLTRFGLREWLTITIVMAISSAILLWLGWWWVVPVDVLLWLAIVSFFRDPWRRIPTDLPPGTMLSPADGTISAVERVETHEATGGPATIVRIFLSVLNVHINRAPCDMVVEELIYRPGKFLDARTKASAQVNESNLVIARTTDNEHIGVRQVSGKIARRIVCPLKPGDSLQRGQRYGMIKFGSTTELILPRPDDVDVRVSPGDRVQGGLTVLAVLHPAQ